MNVPLGIGEFKAGPHWKTQVGGKCENFMARIAWLDNGNRITPFVKPDGQAAEFWFTMCP
jgi:hypothetical protein